MANEDDKRQKAIAAAEDFCEGIKAEKDLRDAIAAIIAKLGRSNISADKGKKQAQALVEAYGILEGFE